MATLLNEEVTQVELDLEAEREQPAEVEREDQVQEPEEDIPEKYQGKSIQELVRMHQEAEKVIGKQGSEVGELRKLADAHIYQQLVEDTAPKKPVEPEEEVDWFADPDKALDAKLNQHPTIKAMEETNKLSAQQASQARLAEKHPDAWEIAQDEEFAKWVRASKVRTKLFIEADQLYDADAADELFSTWKDLKSLAAKTVDTDKAMRKAEAKHASTGGATGSGAEPQKPRFRRTDIINLKINEPEKYAQRANEFLVAYAEGRVY